MLDALYSSQGNYEEAMTLALENLEDARALGDDDGAPALAKLIADEKVIGLFQGRMEFGPRALGNRSIIGDPRSTKMQSIMNQKIKFRESFRPFAPSCLEERIGGRWFNWVGILAILFGVAYGLKYSFDRDWITQFIRF